MSSYVSDAALHTVNTYRTHALVHIDHRSLVTEAAVTGHRQRLTYALAPSRSKKLQPTYVHGF